MRFYTSKQFPLEKYYPANALNWQRLLFPVSQQFWDLLAKKLIQVAEQSYHTGATKLHDLSYIKVIVPTFEHVHLCQQALQANMACSFIPPVIQTPFAWQNRMLPLLVHSSSNNGFIQSKTQKTLDLYSELQKNPWLLKILGGYSQAGLLGLAQQLVEIGDELSQTWLPQAYCASASVEENWQQALHTLPTQVQSWVKLETDLVWKIWLAQKDKHDEVHQKFMQWMQTADEPCAEHSMLFWVVANETSLADRLFLHKRSQQQKVFLCQMDWSQASIPLNVQSMWKELNLDMTKDVCQEKWHAQHLRIKAARSLEDEAWCAAQTLCQWLKEGKQKIAVIAQDRVVTRRLRALLERVSVSIADETGWKISTTRAAASVMTMLDILTYQAKSQDILDFLKSPYFDAYQFALRIGLIDEKHKLNEQNEREVTQTEIWKASYIEALEKRLRQLNVMGGWKSVLACLKTQLGNGDELSNQAYMFLHQLLSQLRAQFQIMVSDVLSQKKNVAQWIEALLLLLEKIGFLQKLEQDEVGRQIHHFFKKMMLEARDVSHELNFSEFKTLLQLKWESAAFTLDTDDKRIVMLPLNGARLRGFDAVYILGCDEKHLPSKNQEHLFFTQAVRVECGLETYQQRRTQQLRDFAEIMLTQPLVVLSWQTQNQGEKQAPSPWLELILLEQQRNQEMLKHLQSESQIIRSKEAFVSLPYAVAPHLMPNTISASAFQSLLNCPYQYFVKYMLGTYELDEISDDVDKRDFGVYVHDILHQYHVETQTMLTPNGKSKISDDEKKYILESISKKVFNQAKQISPVALEYEMLWKDLSIAYLEWAKQHEKNFVYAWGEVAAIGELSVSGHTLTLKGRVDRVDVYLSPEKNSCHQLWDYKLKDSKVLKTKIKNQDDIQLPFYGLMQIQTDSGNRESVEINEAAYLSLDEKQATVEEVIDESFEQRKVDLKKQIESSVNSIGNGENLVANGVETACSFCAYQGICRKMAWKMP